ncbi:MULTISPECIES: hypothetical protein [Cronobacter]|uniref:hypothetical protein n=1 Tax=Cronobacter TaxID=413496 RepID=UPI001F172684|nr:MULTISPECIES: hypothetical protein [Cronobacter]
MDASRSELANGKLLMTFSDTIGSTVGIELSSIASTKASILMQAVQIAASDSAGRVVSSSSLSDNGLIKTTTTDGGDNMESRVAVLENDVSHIKSDTKELKTSVSELTSTVNSIDKNMAVVLERLETIKESLDKKPSTDAVEKRISEAKLAVLLGVPAIIGIATALYKFASHIFHF